jgi:hypothetical protein
VLELLLEGQEIEDVEKFVYLGSILTKSGGSKEDVESQVRKARTSFLSLNKV